MFSFLVPKTPKEKDFNKWDRPEPIELNLIPDIKKFVIPQDGMVKFRLDLGDTPLDYVSVTSSNDAVFGCFDQNNNIIAHLKKEYQCKFVGEVEIMVEAATGIIRDTKDWSKILHQNVFSHKVFIIDIVPSESEKCEPVDYHEKMLAFEDGKLWLREGPLVKYEVEFVYEINRYIYVKNGITRFYPSPYGITFDSTRRPEREATCHFTPVLWDNPDIKCKFDNGQPTGVCPNGRVIIN